MKRLHIARYKQSHNAILSRISSPDAEDLMLFGLERQWFHNRSDISCVPVGVYGLVDWKSPNFGDTWTLVGGEVTPYKEDSPARAGRWGVHLHPANYWHQLLGCIAPGMREGKKDGDLCVWSSRDALKVLQDAMGPPPHVAYISWELPE